MPTSRSRLKIAIIGGGFTGTSLALEIFRHYTQPVDVYLFEKSGVFSQGEAYRTPFPFHLLNVRAKEMSAFEEDPDHFSNWLTASSLAQTHLDSSFPVHEQFAPRFLYHHYLQSLLQQTQSHTASVRIWLKPIEVMNVKSEGTGLTLLLGDQTTLQVDKAVLALGNGHPGAFSFPIEADIKRVDDAWEYRAPLEISRHDPVLILGTGLSMVDTVLTLHHQQHQGKIYALSRHGLLPLPHLRETSSFLPLEYSFAGLREIVRRVRQAGQHLAAMDLDWRSVFQTLRKQINDYWMQSDISSKKQFLRHVLPYWNIHRHRLPAHISELLNRLMQQQQLEILSGRVLQVKDQTAFLRLRHESRMTTLPARWLINCMGPSLSQEHQRPPLLNVLMKQGMIMLNELKLGLAASIQGQIINAAGQVSSQLYVAGPLMKGVYWECTAVPDIRKNTNSLASVLMRS